MNQNLLDMLFARLRVRYGSAWEQKWVGINPEVVKADWSETLGNLGERAIKYGLVNLPLHFPPNAAEFLDICLKMPDLDETKKLSYKPDLGNERVREIIAKTRANLGTMKPAETWARAVLEREDVPLGHREMATRALRAIPPPGILGDFKPVPPECLPPGGLRPEP